jgi:hypothetical protein
LKNKQLIIRHYRKKQKRTSGYKLQATASLSNSFPVFREGAPNTFGAEGFRGRGEVEMPKVPIISGGNEMPKVPIISGGNEMPKVPIISGGK